MRRALVAVLWPKARTFRALHDGELHWKRQKCTGHVRVLRLVLARD